MGFSHFSPTANKLLCLVVSTQILPKSKVVYHRGPYWGRSSSSWLILYASWNNNVTSSRWAFLPTSLLWGLCVASRRSVQNSRLVTEQQHKPQEQKFELLNHLHSGKSCISDLPFVYKNLRYKVSGEKIFYPVENVRDLGVEVSNDRSWSGNTASMVTKAKNTLAWVLSALKVTCNKTVMTTPHKSLLRSTLQFSCPLWNPEKVTDIRQIEGV